MAVFEVHLLDMGQGEAIFLEIPIKGLNGKYVQKYILIDFGSRQNSAYVFARAIYFLKNHKGFKKSKYTLEALILTHGDADHYNKVEDLLGEISITIKTLIYGGMKKDYSAKSKNFGNLIDLLLARTPKPLLISPQNGCHAATYSSELSFYILAHNTPVHLNSSKGHRKNSQSVVVSFIINGYQYIFSGDATTATENQILNTNMKKLNYKFKEVELLKVGHHGSSRTSLLNKWVKAVGAASAYICSDTFHSYKLPTMLGVEKILAHSKLENDSQTHKFIAWYDHKQYSNKNVNDPHLPTNIFNIFKPKNPIDIDKKNNNELKNWEAGWYTFKTKKKIYTTMIDLPYSYAKKITKKDETMGAQYLNSYNLTQGTISNNMPDPSDYMELDFEEKNDN